MSEKVIEEKEVEAAKHNGHGKTINTASDENETETDPVEQVEEDSDESEPAVKNGSKKRKILFIGAGVLILGLIVGVGYWLYARQYESTDDAFIDGDIVQVSPKVSAYVKKIYVNNNQLVHKGDLLVELDPTDYEVKLEQAKAQLATAQSQHGSAQANVDLTEKTTSASRSAASSNVETAKNNVEQTRLAAGSKQSQISQAQAAARTAQANLGQIRAQVPQAESNLKLAQVEYDRRNVLFQRGDISRQSLDQATNTLQTARAQLDAAQKQVIAAQARVDEANAGVTTAQENYKQSLAQVNLTQSQVGESKGRLEDANAAPERVAVSESQVGTAESAIDVAQAAVHQAELELSYTKVYAPEDGFVTKKSIEEGQLVQTGTPMMAISESDDVWVVANFKETQLEHMQIGQSVDVEVDAFPSETFHGKVESFQAGTGSRFSLLPAENATGNYVKVVQRVPVKIVFDESPEKIKRLSPGMSVEPTVKVR